MQEFYYSDQKGRKRYCRLDGAERAEDHFMERGRPNFIQHSADALSAGAEGYLSLG
jgi:hypothetical protein